MHKHFNIHAWAGRDMNERDLQVLDLREQGFTFREIAAMIKNEKTGEIGVSLEAARSIHFYATARKPRYERKQEKLRKITYMKSICQVLMDDSKYIHITE